MAGLPNMESTSLGRTGVPCQLAAWFNIIICRSGVTAGEVSRHLSSAGHPQGCHVSDHHGHAISDAGHRLATSPSAWNVLAHARGASPFGRSTFSSLPSQAISWLSVSIVSPTSPCKCVYAYVLSKLAGRSQEGKIAAINSKCTA